MTDTNKRVHLLDPITWSESRLDNQDGTQSGLTVATFNTLRKNYGFVGKFWVSQKAKEWTYRKQLHNTLLPKLNADILCLQEAELCDTFDEDWEFLRKHGYSVVKSVLKNVCSHNRCYFFKILTNR